MKTITIRLDDDFHKDLKRYALEHDITIQDLTVAALKDKMQTRKVVSSDNEPLQKPGLLL